MKNLHPILLHFGLAVKNLRLEKQMSQEELANRCGLHRTYISDIETGNRNVSLNNITKIARAIGIPLHEMFASVERFSRNGKKPITFHSPSPNRSKQPIEILLVEDDQNFIELILHELQQANINNNITIVRNGEEAIQYLFVKGMNAHPVPPSLRLVLLDLTLPLINGIDVLKRIRQEKSTKKIPVVVMTSSTSISDMEQCKKLDVEGYLTKPFKVTDFVSAMNKIGFNLYLIERLNFQTEN